jgi:hypothetical protein
MRLRLAIILASLGVAGGATAQQRPDLSGTWTAVEGSSTPVVAGRPAPVPVFGPEFAINQEPGALTVARRIGGMPSTIRHPMDGAEVTSRQPGRLCEPDSGSVWTAGWDEEAVVITLVGSIPPRGPRISRAVRSRLRLDQADQMTVEITAPAAGQAEPRVSSTRYLRSGPAPAASATAPAPVVPARTSDVEWLAGVWIGTAGTSTFEERWTPPAGGSMLGVARSLRNEMMSSFEFLCIVERNGGLVYTAMPNGRSPATDFTLTRIDESGATFENPAHDFPKMIRYNRKPDGSVEAVISGGPGQRPQTFVFRKQQ